MPIDFFTNDCHNETEERRFGLCDEVDLPGDPPTPAYSKAYEEEDWIATVENNNNIKVLITAIDHCVIKDDVDERPQACDLMLIYNNCVIFVELKERISRSGEWQENGLQQLFVTITCFKELHPDAKFNERKAYLSNKARPYFPFFDRVEKNRFEDNTGFDLFTETIITII